MDDPLLLDQNQPRIPRLSTFRDARVFARNVKYQTVGSFGPLAMKLANHLLVFVQMGLKAEQGEGGVDRIYGCLNDSLVSSQDIVSEWRGRTKNKRDELAQCLRDEIRYFNLMVELRQMLRDHYVVNYLGEPAANLESFYARHEVDYEPHVAFGHWEALLGRMDRESRSRAEWQAKRESRDTKTPSDQPPLSPDPPKLSAEKIARRVAAMCLETGADGEWEVLLDIIRENAGKEPHERDHGGGVYLAMLENREWDRLARRLRNDEALLCVRFNRHCDRQLMWLLECKVKDRNYNVFLDNQPVYEFNCAGGNMRGARSTDEVLDYVSRLDAQRRRPVDDFKGRWPAMMTNED